MRVKRKALDDPPLGGVEEVEVAEEYFLGRRPSSMDDGKVGRVVRIANTRGAIVLTEVKEEPGHQASIRMTEQAALAIRAYEVPRPRLIEKNVHPLLAKEEGDQRSSAIGNVAALNLGVRMELLGGDGVHHHHHIKLKKQTLREDEFSLCNLLLIEFCD